MDLENEGAFSSREDRGLREESAPGGVAVETRSLGTPSEELGTERDAMEGEEPPSAALPSHIALQQHHVFPTLSLNALDLQAEDEAIGAAREPTEMLSALDLVRMHSNKGSSLRHGGMSPPMSQDWRGGGSDSGSAGRRSLDYMVASAHQSGDQIPCEVLKRDVKKLYSRRRKKHEHRKQHHQLDGEMAEEEDLVIRFLFDVARAMLTYGAPVHELESILTEICNLFGLVSDFYCTPSGLWCSIRQSRNTKARTAVLRINSASVNLQKLSRISDLAERVAEGSLLPSRAIRKIEHCENSQDLYSSLWWIFFTTVLLTTSFAWAVTSRGPDVLCALAISVPMGFVQMAASKWKWQQAFHLTVQGFAAQVLATLWNEWVNPVDTAGVVLSSIGAFLPGLTIAIATSEFASTHFFSGLMRFMASFMVLIEIAVGILVARELVLFRLAVQTVPPSPQFTMDGDPLAYVLVTMAAVSVLAVTFAIYLKVHRRYMWLVVLCSWMSFWSSWAVGRYLSRFVGSVVGAFVSVIFGNVDSLLSTRAAALTAVPGILMVVPGSVAYRGVLSFLSTDSVSGLSSIVSMTIIALGIAVGSYLGTLLWPYSSGIFISAPSGIEEDEEDEEEDWDLSSMSSVISCSDLA